MERLLILEDDLALGEGVRLALQGDDRPVTLCRTLAQARQALEEAGLFQYEISNFSVPGKESRHNLKYWNGDEYLGIGPSAHSFFGGRRFYTPKSLSAFFQAPQYLPEDPDESAIPPGGPEEYTMLRLRLSEGLWDITRYPLLSHVTG